MSALAISQQMRLPTIHSERGLYPHIRTISGSACSRQLAETEFYDDLKLIDVPVLVMHDQDDQICPFPTTGARSVKLLKYGTLKPMAESRRKVFVVTVEVLRVKDVD
jgi:pimeloyl-ACP methyl ester carboxylesterase